MFDAPDYDKIESFPCQCGGDITMDEDGIYRCSNCLINKKPIISKEPSC